MNVLQEFQVAGFFFFSPSQASHSRNPLRHIVWSQLRIIIMILLRIVTKYNRVNELLGSNRKQKTEFFFFFLKIIDGLTYLRGNYSHQSYMDEYNRQVHRKFDSRDRKITLH